MIFSLIFVHTIIILVAYFLFLVKNDPNQFGKLAFSANDIAQMSTGKVIVVTGANSGLGKASAKLLVQGRSARAVIIACRNMKKCRDTKEDISIASSNVEIIPLELDLASLSSIQNFASNLQLRLKDLEAKDGKEKFRDVPKLDVLLNNAGIMGVEYSVSNETNSEMQMHVNHLGHFALTSLLKDNLSNGGRVVSVSSIAGAMPLLNIDDVNFVHTPRTQIRQYFNTVHSLMAYSASKRANLLFTNAMNERFASAGIVAVAAHPGYSRTSLIQKWHFASQRYKELAENNHIGSMSCEEGALSQIRAALDVENVKANQYVGPLYLITGRPVIVGTSLFSFHHLYTPVINKGLGDELWKFSEEAIGWRFENIL